MREKLAPMLASRCCCIVALRTIVQELLGHSESHVNLLLLLPFVAHRIDVRGFLGHSEVFERRRTSEHVFHTSADQTGSSLCCTSTQCPEFSQSVRKWKSGWER